MPTGRYSKWAKASLKEPVWLGKEGIEIVIWDKYGRTRKGTVIVSIGGIRWYPFKAKKPIRLSWAKMGSFR
jgi:hypothetical protein